MEETLYTKHEARNVVLLNNRPRHLLCYRLKFTEFTFNVILNMTCIVLT